MDIYVVQPGDTIYSIANSYGIPVDRLIRDNSLTNPNNLIPGENIVVVLPTETYIVQNGDTIESIADSHGITVSELLRNNPFISDMEYIYPGEVLYLRFSRIGNTATHGYVNTFVDRQTLRKTLPYLTYLTVFNYRSSKNGEVVSTQDDSDIIQRAKEYGVVPLMLMTTLTVQGEVNLELTYEVLLNQEIQNRLFDNVLAVVKEKGYAGVNISAQFITSSNQELFNNYTLNLSNRLRLEGYISVITINPRIEMSDSQVVFEQIEYSAIGAAVDTALFLQYKWGYNFGPPSPVISIPDMSVFLDYALEQIPADKVFVGTPTLGYDWELPYITGFSKASSLTLDSVLNLARNTGAVIEFDEASQTPYYHYQDADDRSQHIVMFVNATTIDSLLTMLSNKNISGTGIWNIMSFYDQMWLVINTQYVITKLLPEF